MKPLSTALALFALALAGCVTENPVEPPICDVLAVDGQQYCVVRNAITETGYRCPADFPHRHDGDEVIICAEQAEVPPEQLEQVERVFERGAPIDPADVGPLRDAGSPDLEFDRDGARPGEVVFDANPPPDAGRPDAQIVPDAGPPPPGGACARSSDCAAGEECLRADPDEGPDVLACGPAACFCNDRDGTVCRQGPAARCEALVDNCLINGCPDGFACEDNRCLCDDPNACASGCAEDRQCDWDEVCDGQCVEAYCLDDAACPAGYVCGAGSVDRLCRDQGDAAVGEGCNLDSDCSTGYCFYGGGEVGICVQPCLANQGCPQEQECAVPEFFDTDVPFCRAPRCGGCAPGEFCTRDGACRVDPCPDGHCLQDTE